MGASTRDSIRLRECQGTGPLDFPDSPLSRALRQPLLVGLFLLGSWLIASLNLEFAENAMGTLRERQITDTFYANLDRINAHHRLMEQSTRGLARAGGLLLRRRMWARQSSMKTR